MTAKPIRMGWIGCGNHASEMLLPPLLSHGVVLTQLCDVDEGRLAEAARRFGVAPASCTKDHRALLGRDDLDAVGMAVGPEQHRDFAIEALGRGLPVFMEKPPGGTLADALKIEAASAKADRLVAIGFMKRFSTANRIAINVTRKPEFGPPASFLGEYMTAPTYFERDPDYLGFYLHHCVHYLDLVPHLMGKPSAIETRRHELAPGKLLLHVHFTFAGGALGTLVMGTHQARSTPMEWWQVMGDHTRVEVRNVHEVRYYRTPQFKADRADASLVDSEDTLLWEPNLTVAMNEDHKGYHAIIGAFLARLRGEAVELPTIADGVRAMAVLEAMLRSLETGERVALA
ncbi:MAG: Gfo/Idh/MocA family oxidoreductase [Proteobacteria bacterium]|nr:Gfo/Idh/MocA family oxidoreductase [Pseudomonadota bacterium]